MYVTISSQYFLQLKKNLYSPCLKTLPLVAKMFILTREIGFCLAPYEQFANVLCIAGP